MKNVGARFRNRKINNKQLLRVYRAVEIPDLDESVSLQRSIPQTETGVDKEEESVSFRTFFFSRHFRLIGRRTGLPNSCTRLQPIGTSFASCHLGV